MLPVFDGAYDNKAIACFAFHVIQRKLDDAKAVRQQIGEHVSPFQAGYQEQEAFPSAPLKREAIIPLHGEDAFEAISTIRGLCSHLHLHAIDRKIPFLEQGDELWEISLLHGRDLVGGQVRRLCRCYASICRFVPGKLSTMDC